MKKLIAFSIVLFAFTAGVLAQPGTASASTTATAVIVGPLSIVKNTDMDFGTIVASATAGTVTLATSGVRTPSAEVSILPAAALGVAASFNVAGEPTRGFSITLPADGAVQLTGPGTNMAVNGFNHNAGANPALNGSGQATFAVGATLSVGANQASGTYTSAAFNVTVNYQ